MEEEFSESKNIIGINKKDISNINKFSLLKEIDNIINKSKNELEEIQLQNHQFNKFYQSEKNKNDNYNIKSLNNIKNNSSNFNKIEELILNKKDINNNNINKDFDLERLNLKLTSDLTIERAKVHELDIKLKLKDKEISSLKKQLNFTQMNFYNKQIQFEKILEQKENKSKNILPYKKDLCQNQSSNALMVKSFFNFFNKYLELFNQLEIIDTNYKQKLIFIENDTKNLNIKNVSFVINTFDELIDKLIKENREMFEKLSKYEKKDVNNNLQNINELEINFENIKNENIFFNGKEIFNEKLLKDNKQNFQKNKYEENNDNKKFIFNNEIEQKDNNNLIHNEEIFENSNN